MRSRVSGRQRRSDRSELPRRGRFSGCRPTPALLLPVGNAGNITAYWKGFKEYQTQGRSDTLPRMFGFQAAGAAPIVDGHPIEDPNTVATAIRIGNPASWQGATTAVEESHGHIGKVADEEILAAQKLIARTEGIFVEPACGAALAGLMKCSQSGTIPEGSLVTANACDPCAVTSKELTLRNHLADVATSIGVLRP